MEGPELELFSLVDNARQQRGCAPLGRDSDLTYGARSDAATRADNGDVSDESSSMAATGGDGVNAREAFDRLKRDSSGTIFNCGHRELGVGQARKSRESCVLVFCSTKTRYAWVVDFD
jgi:hypothetical protein